jgi:23S rRNA (cytosine1962-C5)-methyltransferase
MQYILGLKVVSRYGGKLDSQELGLRVSATGLAVPCGASARWYNNKD